MLDFLLFEIFKQTKKLPRKDLELHFIADHSRRMFRILEMIENNSTARDSFRYTGFTDPTNLQDNYTLEFKERKICLSSAFKELRNINVSFDGLSHDAKP
jgi:hypothetical protein